MNQEVIKLLTVLCRNISLDIKITPNIKNDLNSTIDENNSESVNTSSTGVGSEKLNKETIITYINTFEKYLNTFKIIIENT